MQGCGQQIHPWLSICGQQINQEVFHKYIKLWLTNAPLNVKMWVFLHSNFVFHWAQSNCDIMTTVSGDSDDWKIEDNYYGVEVGEINIKTWVSDNIQDETNPSGYFSNLSRQSSEAASSSFALHYDKWKTLSFYFLP